MIWINDQELLRAAMVSHRQKVQPGEQIVGGCQLDASRFLRESVISGGLPTRVTKNGVEDKGDLVRPTRFELVTSCSGAGITGKGAFIFKDLSFPRAKTPPKLARV